MKCKCGAKTNYGCKTCPACSMEQREARQREVVSLWATGMNDRQIADQMNISPKTAQWHLLQVRRKHRLSCAQDLMRWALKTGLATLCFTLSVCAQPVLPTAVVVPDTNTFDAHLAWDRSPSPEAAGYRVYFGTNQSKLASSVLAGNTTNLTVPALSATAVWYFAAAAYDTNGFESDLSNVAQLPAAAAPEYPGITLAWDAPADTNVAGFWVYWGVKSRTYTNSILVGTNRTMTFTTLLPSVLYYFAATSTDKTGIQSDFSTEASGMMQTNFPPTTNAIAYLWIEASPRPTGPFTNANLFTKTLTNATQAALYYRLMGAK